MSDVEPSLVESGIDQDFDAAEPVIDLRDGAGSPSSGYRLTPVRTLARRRLFGLDFVDASNLEPIISSLLRRPLDEDGRMDTVLTPNVDIMVHLTRPGAEHSVEWHMFRQSRYCLPDGQPIVLASRLLGRPLGARLTGSGLFALLWPRLVTDGRPVFMVASSATIVDRLRDEYPDLRATVAPMFDADDLDTVDDLALAIIDSATDRALEYVVLGVGNPKDARLAESILRQWPTSLGRPPTLLALGGSASMYVGLTKRAPGWVQRIGMEWFYRFVQEPRRLFHRYFVRDMAFVKLVWRHWRSDRNAGTAQVGERVRAP